MGIQNDYWLQLTGKVNIPSPLINDHSYKITGNFDVYTESQSSNQDGSYNITFRGKFTDEIFLEKNGEVMRATNKTSHSQDFRKKIFNAGHDYDEVMKWIKHPDVFPIIIEMFENK